VGRDGPLCEVIRHARENRAGLPNSQWNGG
jgi:hypothetical protein